MIQNLDSRINKLQAQCDYLRHKLSTFPEGELFIQKNGSYHRWCKWGKNAEKSTKTANFQVEKGMIVSE